MEWQVWSHAGCGIAFTTAATAILGIFFHIYITIVPFCSTWLVAGRGLHDLLRARLGLPWGSCGVWCCLAGLIHHKALLQKAEDAHGLGTCTTYWLPHAYAHQFGHGSESQDSTMPKSWCCGQAKVLGVQVGHERPEWHGCVWVPSPDITDAYCVAQNKPA